MGAYRGRVRTPAPKEMRSRPGDWAGSLSPVVGDGEGGDSTGFLSSIGGLLEGSEPPWKYVTLSGLRQHYSTEPTATLRSSSIATQVPELRTDCRFRKV
jgi:hypothetical protein